MLDRAGDPTLRAHWVRPADVAGQVLVVDDDPSAVQVCQSVLASSGHVLRYATDGQQALERLREHPADLVLLDAQMPGLHGLEVCRQMKVDTALRDIPVVFVTQRVDVEFEVRALEVGAADFVRKPYSPAVLRNRVANLLQLHRYHRQTLAATRMHWKQLSEARMRDIVFAASDGIVTADAVGLVVLINDAAHQQLRLAPDSATGRPVADILPRVSWTPGHAGHADPAPPLAIAIRRADGTCFDAELAVFRTGTGAERLTTVIIRDVSLRRQAERAERMQLQSEAMHRARSLFMAYVAHEIGNPLNGVVGLAELMATDTGHPLPLPQATRLAHLRTAAAQLCALREDLIEAGRREVAAFSVASALHDVLPVVQQALEAARGVAEAAGVSLQGRGVLDGPSTLAWCDTTRLRQCLDNLLSNAIKYNRPGGWVELRLVPAGGEVLVEVLDGGIGMSHEQTLQLFEPFNRLGRDASPAPGFGLGMALTRDLVKAFGGSIEVASELGRGTHLTIRLQAQGPA